MLLDGLPNNHFRCIHADIPWRFNNWSEAGAGRSPEQHYETMSLRDVLELPVRHYASRSCHLFFWVTGPMVVTGAHTEIMRSWGFEPTAMAFVWVKLNPKCHPRWMGYIDGAIESGERVAQEVLTRNKAEGSR